VIGPDSKSLRLVRSEFGGRLDGRTEPDGRRRQPVHQVQGWRAERGRQRPHAGGHRGDPRRAQVHAAGRRQRRTPSRAVRAGRDRRSVRLAVAGQRLPDGGRLRGFARAVHE